MSDHQQSRLTGEEDFFVGYLATSKTTRRILWRVLPVACVAVGIVGGMLAAAQRDPGPGVWEDGTAHTIEGVIVAQPYPMLRTTSSSAPGDTHSFLLVSEGKFGAEQRVRGLDGKAVRLTGTLLHRDGRSLLELAEGPAAIAPLDRNDRSEGRMKDKPETEVGQVTLRGEIIDPKCYIGAMKPGGGKTHKACAQLCISGGIPPMLVTRSPQGIETFYLLVDSENRPVNRTIVPFVGDPVEVRGSLARLDDVLILRINPSRINRL